MKVLMVGPSLLMKGGISTVLNNYKDASNVFNKHNVKIDFFKTINTNIKYKQIASFIYRLLLFSKIVKYYDIVHIHVSSKGSFLRKNIIAKICIKNNIPYIVHLHGSEFKLFFNKLNKRKQEIVKNFFKNANYNLVLGDKWKEFVGGITSNYKNIIVLNNAVPQYEVINNSERMREDFLTVGFLGQIGKRKGVFDLIECVDELLDDINVLVKIAGNGELEHLNQLISKTKDPSRFEVVGWIDALQKKDFFNSIDLLALPSYNEGLPMSILESMSYSKPIISTNVGSIEEAVINNKNGFIILPGDKQQLASAIKMFSIHPYLLNEMGNESRRIFEEKFLLGNHIQKLAKIYKEIGRFKKVES